MTSGGEVIYLGEFETYEVADERRKLLAKAALDAALVDSVWIETSTESDTFRSMKLAAIRRDVSLSWESTR